MATLFLTVPAVPLLVLLAEPARADAGDRPATADEIERVRGALASAGYGGEIHDVELDDGRLEADVRDASGRFVEVELDAATLAILSIEAD